MAGGSAAERLNGFAGNDAITGNAGNDWLDGGAGADHLDGGEGDDVLVGGFGDDLIEGGLGRDVLVLSGSVADYSVTPMTGGWRLSHASGRDVIRDVEAVRIGNVEMSWDAFVATAFDGLRYIASHRDLMNAFGADAEAGRRHYREVGISEFRGVDAFDPLLYVASNPDLARRFGDDAARAITHYIKFGRFENRPLASFDALAYAAVNLDVAERFGADVRALARHYAAHGVHENRPLRGFDAIAYAASNPDIARTFGANVAKITEHYVSDGRLELRLLSGFDALGYAAVNRDVALRFGADEAAISRHYVSAGVHENRRLGGFDALAYAAVNPDVANRHGVDVDALTRHYVANGVREGRPIGGFDALLSAASNPDVAQAFGSDVAQLTRHYVLNGRFENRPLHGLAPNVVSKAVSAPAILEDAVDPQPSTVRALFGASFADADQIAAGAAGDDLAGVAVIASGLAPSLGEWQYFDGQSWVGIGAVSPSNALLLGGDTRIRFLPGRDFNGEAPSLLVHLIDDSRGAIHVGARVNLTGEASLGGTTRYSIDTVELSQFVEAVEDLPLAEDDLASVYEAALPSVTGNVLANDHDPEDALAVVSVAATGGLEFAPGGAVEGDYGTLVMNADGSYTYTLDPERAATRALTHHSPGVDVFLYSISDGKGGFATASLTVEAHAQLFSQAGQLQVPGTPAIGDFNKDGLVEPWGQLNNGDGTFTLVTQIHDILAGYPEFQHSAEHCCGACAEAAAAADAAGYALRVHRDNRVADFDGDGNLDVMFSVYSDPSDLDSFALVFYGDGTGGVKCLVELPEVRGFGETITVADFDNDGDPDLFMPVYTYPGVSESNYLFFNDGAGLFGENQAAAWGVALTDYPERLKVEGAQAVDVDFDGRIDLYTASILFMNNGTGFEARPLAQGQFDEGSSLFDYDNDGDFDLLLAAPNGPKLYTWDGGGFDAGRELAPGLYGTYFPIGLNVYDIDGNGWEDFVTRDTIGTAVFFNYGGVFEQVSFPTPSTGDIRADLFAFFDYDGDRRIDLVGRTAPFLNLYRNELPEGSILALSVLGANGEQNQHGRPITLRPHADPDIVMARVVDSGSGFLSQNQYELLIGLPVDGGYDVEITFANAILRFVAGEGQTISAYADGRVDITGSAGADLFGGSTGADVLVGGEGDDHILGSAGGDRIDGGSGDDLLDFSAFAQSVRVDLASGSAQVAGVEQALANIEHLIGSDFSDELIGDDRSNMLSGRGGDDLIMGGAGGDRIRGGEGSDRITLGAGADIVIYGGASDSTGGSADVLTGFEFGVDLIDLPGDEPRSFIRVDTGVLNSATIEADLAAAMQGKLLEAGGGALFLPDSGDMTGRVLLVVDANGQGGYQPGADLVIELAGPPPSLEALTLAVI